ncbi:clostripain [Thioploca ingrica]|uniref:Clostripain n=1 Tax=Thioploca ingrica TaxID=40754 RepID=A0A090AAN2_9GAMM|nr:clostripain [Thioploca ingrica]
MRIKLFICCYLLTFPTFAIYDLASINITPSPQGTSFCFLLDSAEKEIYLALTVDDKDLLFLSPTTTGAINFTAWQPPIDPPVFLEKKIRPNCFGPFSADSLQGIKLYAGVGHSFSDLIEQQKYLRIFENTPPLTSEEKAWTVMVYQVGSTLERVAAKTLGNASKDILEMLAGMQFPENRNINVVIATGGSSREGWKTVKRSLIRDGQWYVLEDLGEQSMGNPQTLSDFVLWAKDKFPARQNALILWNHGGGTQGFGQDTSKNANEQMMSLSQLHQAFQTIRPGLGKPLDLVIYDACVMATIEVAEITATVANAMAGSAEIEPAHGIDYTYLLRQLSTALPTEGIVVGQLAKEGYIQQSKAVKTFNTSQITYSVLDLTQLSTFSEAFSQFAEELGNKFKEEGFLSYEALSQGIIRVPGYPIKETGRLLRSLDEQQTIRIDLYNFLQTISLQFPQLKSYAEELQTNLQRLVVDYETNDPVKAINPEAGRISIDIGSEKSYLPVLPAAYTQFSQALDYYSQRRQADTFEPNGEFVCLSGFICAAARWLELQADEVISIDGYYGQPAEQGMDVYLIKPLYRYQPLEQNLAIGVKGQEACQYQLCVSKTECSNLTVTESQRLRLAEVLYNDRPAILTLCQDENASWKACSVLPQQSSLWGRDEPLSTGDTLTPTVLHLQEGKLSSQQSRSLVVGETAPILNSMCDLQKAVIAASYFSHNNQPQFESLCDKGDCVCQANDEDESCRSTDFQFKAGVRLNVF